MDTQTIQDIAIPKLGYGTWQLEGDKARNGVSMAIEIGYRHIDTAAIYRNEREVGQGIADSGIDRSDLFVTTKIWNEDIAAGRHMEAMDASLERLGLDHVDLILLHWPLPELSIADQVGPLADIQKSGKARLVGVSNYTSRQIGEAVDACDVPLACVQCEYHPLLDQTAVLDAARRHDMLFTSYSPIGQGELLDHPAVKELAGEHGVSPAQIVLRWHIQQDHVAAIPKATSRGHIEQNFDIFGFELSEEAMTRLHGLAKPDGRLINPGWAPDWD